MIKIFFDTSKEKSRELEGKVLQQTLNNVDDEQALGFDRYTGAERREATCKCSQTHIRLLSDESLKLTFF